MKKLLALFLAVCMIVSVAALSGCSKTETATTEEAAASTAETAESTPAGTEEATATPTAAEEAAAPTEDQWVTVRVGSTNASFIGHFDATNYFSSLSSTAAMANVYDSIFYVDPYTGEYKSDILESWNYDEAANLLELKLRDDVYFASGDQMTAEDIEFSITRLATSERGAALYGAMDLEGSYPADDGTAYYVHFNQVYGPYASLLRYAVLNKSWVEEHGGDDYDWYDYTIVDGSGPYKVTAYEMDMSLTMEVRDDWWGWNAGYDRSTYCAVDEYICKAYTDETTMMVDYENGELDMVLKLSSTEAKKVQDGTSRGVLATASSNCVAVLYLDTENQYLQNEDLRAAICYAVDGDAIGNLVYGILYQAAGSSLASSNPYYVDGYSYEYDLDKAKEYLAKSGMEGVTLTIVTDNDTANMCEAFQYQMEQLGINIDLQVYDFPTCIGYWTTAGGNDIQADQVTNVNEDNEANGQYERMNSNFECPNSSDPEVKELLEKGLNSTDTAVRAEAYAEIQEYVYDNYLCVPICEWLVAYAYDDSLIASAPLNNVYMPSLRFVTPAN